MNVIIYRDFSESYEVKQINAQGKIKDVFAQYSPDKYAFIVNSVRQNEEYFVKENDSVIIRAIPHVTGVMIASAVVAGVAAIIGGVVAYKAKKQADDAQNELDKIKNSLSSDSSSITSPMMSGASNTVATGKTQPFVMGRRLFTPYLLTSEWDTLRGVYTVPAVNEEFNATFTVKRKAQRTGGKRSGYDYIVNNEITVTFVKDWSGKVDVSFQIGTIKGTAIKITGHTLQAIRLLLIHRIITEFTRYIFQELNLKYLQATQLFIAVQRQREAELRLIYSPCRLPYRHKKPRKKLIISSMFTELYNRDLPNRKLKKLRQMMKL